MHHTRDGINIYNHTPQKRATFLAFHQQAAEQLRHNLLGGAGEEGWGEVTEGSWWLWEWLRAELAWT